MTHFSKSFQANSKCRRAESFEACCQWVLLFTFTAQKFVQLSFCNYMNVKLEFLESAAEWTFTKEGVHLHRTVALCWVHIYGELLYSGEA